MLSNFRTNDPLPDKAYPKWPAEQVKEVLRNQFIHGIRSSSVQLKLMKDMPKTLDDALQLASQQESVEAAQKRLHREKHCVESLAVDPRDDLDDPDSVFVSTVGARSTNQML